MTTTTNFLVILIIIDTVFGVLAAIANGKLKSRKMTTGVMTNLAVVVSIILVQSYIPEQYLDIADYAIAGLILAQAISIVENIERLGFPLPESIKQIKNKKNIEKVDNNVDKDKKQ